MPTITTIENCMKLCPMIVQGFWEFKNPLLQLPHITEDNLKYFLAKKVLKNETTANFLSLLILLFLLMDVSQYLNKWFSLSVKSKVFSNSHN